MKEKHFRILLWSGFFLLLAVVLYFFSQEDFNTVRPVEAEAGFLLHEKEQIPREEIDLYIVHEGKLYLFYIDNELINVYADSGEFLYGLQFPDFQNGISDMACHAGVLYVDARGAGYYVFDGKNLLRHGKGTAVRKELEAIFTGEYCHTDGEYIYTYVVEKNKMIRSGSGTTKDLLVFPKKDERIMPLFFGAFILITGLSWLDRKKQNNANTADI